MPSTRGKARKKKAKSKTTARSRKSSHPRKSTLKNSSHPRRKTVANKDSTSSVAWKSMGWNLFGEMVRDMLLVRGVGFEPTKAYATGFLLKPDLKSSTTPSRSGPAPLT